MFDTKICLSYFLAFFTTRKEFLLITKRFCRRLSNALSKSGTVCSSKPKLALQIYYSVTACCTRWGQAISWNVVIIEGMIFQDDTNTALLSGCAVQCTSGSQLIWGHILWEVEFQYVHTYKKYFDKLGYT